MMHLLSQIMFIIFVFNFLPEIQSNADIRIFFPQINGNLSDVTWAYSINNQSYLDKVLTDNITMMIEVDVILDTIIDSKEKVPVVAYYSKNTLNLTLEDFLNKIKKANEDEKRKGIKLGFKSIEAFDASLKLIEDANKEKYPLWINADILTGTGNPEEEPINKSTEFLNKAIQFTEIVLSLGWTTTNTSGEFYKDENIQEMINIINTNNIKDEITFPVRACLAENSYSSLHTLLQEINNSTLTIWSLSEDTINLENLRQLIEKIGVNKIFINVPDDIREKLRLDFPKSAAVFQTVSTLSLIITLLVINIVYGY